MLDAMPVTMGSVFRELGIENPVPMDVLEAYKADQVRRHPRSWLAGWTPFTAIGVVVCAALFFRVWQVGLSEPWSVGVALSLVVTAFGTNFVALLCYVGFLQIMQQYFGLRLLQQARWVERGLRRDDRNRMPIEIERVVNRLRCHWTRPTFVIGELMQDKVNLDPYVVVDIAGEKACLGIWDGGLVRACADVVPAVGDPLLGRALIRGR